MATSDELAKELEDKKAGGEADRQKLQEALDARKQEEEDRKKADEKDAAAHDPGTTSWL